MGVDSLDPPNFCYACFRVERGLEILKYRTYYGIRRNKWNQKNSGGADAAASNDVHHHLSFRFYVLLHITYYVVCFQISKPFSTRKQSQRKFWWYNEYDSTAGFLLTK